MEVFQHLWLYAVPAIGAVLVLIKHKAIGAEIGAAWKRFTAWLWRTVRKNVLPDANATHVAGSRQIQEKTYRGLLGGFVQLENYPSDWCFTLRDGTITTKVPVHQTNLLGGVQYGQLVEIDTQVFIGLRLESVKRVRIIED